MKKRATAPWLALMVGLAACVLSAKPSAAKSKYEVESLKGLKGVAVVVEHIDSDGQAMGLTASGIQTQVELALRMAGVRVLTLDECFKEPGGPYLYVAVVTLAPTESGVAAYTVEVSLNQSVVLGRPAQGESGEKAVKWLPGARTWYDLSLGIGKDSSVQKSIKSGVDLFLNDYLTANPKSGT